MLHTPEQNEFSAHVQLRKPSVYRCAAKDVRGEGRRRVVMEKEERRERREGREGEGEKEKGGREREERRREERRREGGIGGRKGREQGIER